MKISALSYYVSSTLTLINGLSFWKIPLLFFKKTVLFKLKNSLEFYVSDLMDVWTLKEIILDDQYQQFKKIRKNEVVVDIGAGVGDFSVLVSRRAKKVFAFEMNREKFKLLEKNVKINRCQNIVIASKEVDSLETVFRKLKINDCDFLKIDCEGCEYQIFKDVSKKTLSRIKYIAMEVHFFNQKMKHEYLIFKNLLISHGFKIREVASPVHCSIGFLYAEKNS